MATVAITQSDDIESALSEALGHLPVERLVRGKLVAVKPNDTWASSRDTTGVTQPDTLRGVLRYVKRFGPRELVVTGGAGAAETDEVFRIAGLMEVVEEEGASFFDHNRPPFTAVDLTYAPAADVEGPQKSVMVNPRVLEYETLIALNQLKLGSRRKRAAPLGGGPARIRRNRSRKDELPGLEPSSGDRSVHGGRVWATADLRA